MRNHNAKLHRRQVEAAEKVVVDGIPSWLKAKLDAADKKHKAKGGCPGCGSMIFAVHYGGCPTGRNDCY